MWRSLMKRQLVVKLSILHLILETQGGLTWQLIIRYCLYEIWRRADAQEPGNNSENRLTNDLSNTGNHSASACETDCQPNGDIPKHSICTMEEGIITLKDVSSDSRMDISKWPFNLQPIDKQHTASFASWLIHYIMISAKKENHPSLTRSTVK